MGTLHQVHRRSGSSVETWDGVFMVGRIVTEGCESCQPMAGPKKSFRNAPERKMFMI